MSRAVARAAAVALAVYVAVLLVGALTLTLTDGSFPVLVEPAVIVVSFSAVGGVLAFRLPEHRIGWLLLAIGVASTSILFEEYAGWALAARRDAPLVAQAAWLSSWAFTLNVAGIIMLLPLLFPTGSLPSRSLWWRLAAVAPPLYILAGLGRNAFGRTLSDLTGDVDVPNPYAVQAIADAAGLFDVLAPLAFFIGFVSAVTACVVRFRRSRGAERAQLKWFTFAIVLTPSGFLAYEWAGERIATLLIAMTVPLVPVAVGVAVLRYRLYDIDRIISRTVSYAIVTAVIALPYLLLVPLVTRVVGGSSVAVAAGTLAAAAAFNPVRRRVQASVDRRFNRARYDAARTVDLFASRLRDEVDLDTLTAELIAVVRQTVQPASATLWLRTP